MPKCAIKGNPHGDTMCLLWMETEHLDVFSFCKKDPYFSTFQAS